MYSIRRIAEIFSENDEYDDDEYQMDNTWYNKFEKYWSFIFSTLLN